MPESITSQIQALRKMTVAELREKHLELFGTETRSHHKDQLALQAPGLANPGAGIWWIVRAGQAPRGGDRQRPRCPDPATEKAQERQR